MFFSLCFTDDKFVMSFLTVNIVTVLFQSPELISGLVQLLKTNTAISELVLSNVCLKWSVN